MNESRIQNYFFMVVLGAVCVLLFFILKPFLNTLFLAGVFAVVFQPIYRFILRKIGNWESFAAFLTTSVIIALILIPLSFLGVQIFKEARGLYIYFAFEGGVDFISGVLENSKADLHRIFPSMVDFSINLNRYAEQGFGWLIKNLGSVFSNIAQQFVYLLIFLVSFYYLLKDGGKLIKNVIKISPLADENDELIANKLKMAVHSVVMGNLTIACIQGVMVSLGLIVFGVPNAILWGTVAAIFSLIPTIGTAPVTFSAVVFLFLSGHLFPAIGLAIWGALGVGLIDNFLSPKLVGKSMSLHPLFIFISVLGGVVYFGPLGVLFGPLAVSLFFALLEIYFHLFKKI